MTPDDMPFDMPLDMQRDNTPEPIPAATAVGALLAPVVACLRGDDDGVRALFEGACEDGVVPAALQAAPAVVRVYLRLAPPPDGAHRIVSGYVAGALDRFGDREVVAIGAECLEVARAEAAIAPIANAVFVDAALEHGRWCALVGAVASCWWCAERGAALRGSDPVEETAAICRYLASVA
ncbi:MAG: hypothetical protein ACRDV7_13390 [Acidimicrobiia bacterium]|jgi:hypothetical protein